MKDLHTIEEQAARLARWLDDHPGAAPPDGVDPDVLETIYALRPELAPAPSFSVDDILAGITTGPFAQPAATGELVELSLPPPSQEADANDLVEAPTDEQPDDAASSQPPAAPTVVDLASERRRRSPWMWSTVGAVAAAAMALIVAVPHLDSGISDEALYAPLQQPAATPVMPAIAELEDDETERTTVSDPSPAQPDELDGRLARELQGPTRAAGKPTAGQDSRTGEGVVGLLDSLLGSGSSGAPAPDRGDQGRDGVEPKKDRAGDAGPPAPEPEAVAAAEPPPAWYTTSSIATSAPAGATTDLLRDGVSTRGDASIAQGPVPPADMPAPPPTVSTPSPAPAEVTGGAIADNSRDREERTWEDEGAGFAEFDSFDAGAADSPDRSRRKQAEAGERSIAYDADDLAMTGEEAEPAEAEEVESISASRYASSRVRGQSSGRSSRAPKARSDDLEEAGPAPAQPQGSSALSLDDLRASANPLDYRSEWYLGDPALNAATKTQLANAYGQAQAALVSGDAAAALAVLVPLLSSSYPRVVQDAAFRIATLQLQQGQRGTALATVGQGLAASGSTTVYRSRLLALRGSILEEQGDNAGAMDAYRQAVEANTSRY